MNESKKTSAPPEGQKQTGVDIFHVLDGFSRYQIDDLDRWVWQIAHNRYARFIESSALTRPNREYGNKA